MFSSGNWNVNGVFDQSAKHSVGIDNKCVEIPRRFGRSPSLLESQNHWGKSEYDILFKSLPFIREIGEI